MKIQIIALGMTDQSHRKFYNSPGRYGTLCGHVQFYQR